MTHTPEAIRALLDGITAGARAWESRKHGDLIVWDIKSPASPISLAHVYTEADARLIAASPAIARYALELAAENERLRAAYAVLQPDGHQWSTRPCPSCRQITTLVGFDFGCSLYAKQHAAARAAALAPQPAPTDGAS